MDKTPDGSVIEGFPNAVKVIALDGPKGRRLSDLSLHRYDLDFSAECLDTLNKPETISPIIRIALWETAIIHYMKCFGASKSRRFTLIAEKIYEGEPAEWRIIYSYFVSLRHKNIAHDENSVLQGKVGAVLNDSKAPQKIEKIICFVATSETLDQTSWSNLSLLIKKARSWVEVEYDKLAESLTADVESLSHAELLAMPSLTFSPARSDEMHLPRSV